MRPVTHYLLAYTTELGCTPEFRKEGNVSFNDALNTFYFQLYGRCLFRWLKKKPATATSWTIFLLAARELLYASFHKQGGTYHKLYYTSRGALTKSRNSSKGPP